MLTGKQRRGWWGLVLAGHACLLFAGLLVACSTPFPVERYDFGVPPTVDPAPGAPAPGAYAASEVEVLAPAWLDTPAVLYRLAYADDSQVHAYAQSQWVAPPARLVEQALQRAAIVPATAACSGPARGETATAAGTARLSVELDEFSQVFDSAQSSRVILRARVRLLAARTHALLAQRDFDFRNAAISPDAPGAVHGLRDLTNAFVASVMAWAAAQALPACDPPAPSPGNSQNH
jgi:cholesterol transport system auxiliary component